MASKIEYAPLNSFALDPFNPRLGLSRHEKELDQDQLYDLMKDWSLEELATSFLESGFWAHEAVLCVKEEIDGTEYLVVVEGNRRIAALKRLLLTFDGTEQARKWKELVDDFARPADLFDNVPYILCKSREAIASFLGFRHVTGIKEWAPPEKAQFIAKLIDEGGLTYRQVMRRIGSKTDVVERNYIAYCLLLQMQGTEALETDAIENRFSVLFLSLRTTAVRKFLGIEDKFGINPADVTPPVSEDNVDKLREYSKWLFGDATTPPVVKDSREIDKFSRVLASEEGLAYLRSVKRPVLEQAFVVAGGDQEEVLELIATATYSLQDALSSIHLYKSDDKIITLAKRLIANTEQLKKTIEI